MSAPARSSSWSTASSALSLADLAEHCRELGLAKQKVPEQLEFVDEVPRNAMGKIDKPSLRKRYT